MPQSLDEYPSFCHHLKTYSKTLVNLSRYFSSIDLELLILTDENISKFVESIRLMLWNNASVLHKLLIQFFEESSSNITSFLSVEGSLKNLELSLEGLSPASSKKSESSLFDVYSRILDKIERLIDLNMIEQSHFATITSQAKAQIIQFEDGNVVLNADASQTIPRPQLTFFDYPIDNTHTATFVPRKEAIEMGAPFTSAIESLLCSGEPLNRLTDISKEFAFNCISSLLSPSYKLMELRPLKIIETFSQLEDLCKHLREVSLFAVDVEYHSLRSFRGFSCLIQISTTQHDFIVDALVLRKDLYLLNESFGDPSKLKIFHGSQQDLLWLQKDFSIFVAGIFDTFIAASTVLALPLPSLSLSSLVTYFCSSGEANQELVMDKELQLADWRIRPLSEDMIRYARADTYFLLSLFANLIRKISTSTDVKGWIEWSIRESSALALIQYVPEDPKKTSDLECENALAKAQRSINISFSASSIKAFKVLWNWRDTIAREEDESIRYVLPTFMMIKIAQRLPSDAQSVRSCCNPVPPLVHLHASDLALMVWKAATSTETISQPTKLTALDKALSYPTPEIIALIQERQKTIHEEISLLLRGNSWRHSTMTKLLTQKNKQSDTEERYSKVEDIVSTFSLMPWEFDDDSAEKEPPSKSINPVVDFSAPIEIPVLDDLSEPLKKKKQKKKKRKIMDPLEFINSTKKLTDDKSFSVPEIDTTTYDVKLKCLASRSSDLQLAEKDVRSFGSTIEIPSNLGVQKKRSKSHLPKTKSHIFNS